MAKLDNNAILPMQDTAVTTAQFYVWNNHSTPRAMRITGYATSRRGHSTMAGRMFVGRKMVKTVPW